MAAQAKTAREWADKWGVRQQVVYQTAHAHKDQTSITEVDGKKLYDFSSAIKKKQAKATLQAVKKTPTKRKAKATVKAPASELDKLIAAASAVGTENELLKRKLDAIRKILEE